MIATRCRHFALLALACVVGLGSAEIDLTTALQKEAQAMSAQLNPNALIDNVQAIGDLKAYNFTTAQECIDTLPKLDLPIDAQLKLKDIIAVQSLAFQTFHFQLTKSQAELVEFIGAARHLPDKVEIAYMSTDSKGTPRPVFTNNDVKHCNKIWTPFGDIKYKCDTDHKQVPRGFTPDEIKAIEDTLRAKAYEHIGTAINSNPVVVFSPPPSVFDAALDNSSSSSLRGQATATN